MNTTDTNTNTNTNANTDTNTNTNNAYFRTLSVPSCLPDTRDSILAVMMSILDAR